MLKIDRQSTMALAGAALLGLLAGGMVVRRPEFALLGGIGVLAIIGLAMLGDRSFAWAIVLLAVIPWYPFISDAAVGPRVSQKILCAAIVATPLVPWLWSIGSGTRRTRPSPGALLLAILYATLALLTYGTLGGVQAMINSQVCGWLFGGVAFLCARRFADLRAWPAAALVGTTVLLIFGFVAYASAPGDRIGSFTGYPITYGALLVGLAPAAMLAATRRSWLVAAVLTAATGGALILSESRSSWIAVAVMLIAFVAIIARQRRGRALAGAAVAALAVVTLVMTVGSLHQIVAEKVNPDVLRTDSVTHRTWSYGFALGQIGEHPLFGAGAPGFSAHQSANQTAIGALDNGYLSTTVDLGLLGLTAVLVPIALALLTIGRCLAGRIVTAEAIALALGITGIATVTIFYDSFYWAQINLLLFGMGGVLSTQIRTRSPARRRTAVPRSATGAMWQLKPRVSDYQRVS